MQCTRINDIKEIYISNSPRAIQTVKYLAEMNIKMRLLEL